MTRQLIVLAITCLAIWSSCTTDSTQELSAEQKEAIIEEIEVLWQYSGEGIEQLNAEQAFSVFSNSKETKYIRNGHLYPDIETARNEYAGWFKSPDAAKQKLTCDPIYYDVLDEKSVLMTTIGSLVKVDETSSDQQPWILAYTLVWRKEVEGWKLIHMHNSWE